MITRLFIASLICVLLASCARRHSDPRLDRVAELIDANPAQALDSLEVIDYAALPDADRHYLDFLSVKAADKAYIPHASDSLILDAVQYYSRHDAEGILPEALYYAGRVKSDLGDYPVALKCYQDALDILPKSPADPTLKRRILSQTGRFLDAMSLFNEAIPYLEAAINEKGADEDTISLIYNLQLLGAINLRAENYVEAESCFKKALNLSYNKPHNHIAKTRMYIAAVNMKVGNIDSALCYVRGTIDSVNLVARNSALGYAAEIYLQAGILDTAYAYAYDLITNDDMFNKEIGYQTILSPELRSKSSQEQIDEYIAEYRTLLEDYYDDNQNNLTFNQQNKYNYKQHYKKRLEIEENNHKLKVWLSIAITLLLSGLFLVVYLKKRIKPERSEFVVSTKNPDKVPQSYIDSQALRENLRQEFIVAYERNRDQQFSIPNEILGSEEYITLQKRISKEDYIKENDEMWPKLEALVLRISPKFKDTLDLLTKGRLTKIELQTAILIKCGIKPSEMTKLFCKSNGTIISRRESMGKKIFDEKVSVKIIDGIIRLM